MYMKKKPFEIPIISRIILAVAVTLSLGCLASPAVSADGINPDADKILRSMSTYLGNLSSFSVKADLNHEIITLAGQKLLGSSSGIIIVDRPGKIYAHRRGPLADMVVIFDGKTLTLNEKNSNVYARIEGSGTIDDAFRAISFIGLDAPAADLLYADSYAGLVTGVSQGVYLGTAYVQGAECHHLAFRADRVDWQLWVQTGDTPLPLKYVVTSKWVTGAPQYVVQFRDWNTKPQIEAGQFTFIMPEGARNLETILVNEVGELMIEGGQK
jgi:hypothetical protein